MRHRLTVALCTFAALCAMLAPPAFAAGKPAAKSERKGSGDPVADGEAAYKAHDAMGILEAYGPLIADGDQPEDGRVWDRLALAARSMSPTDGTPELENYYWKRSTESGQRTGRKVLEEWSAAWNRNLPFSALFQELLTHGDWMSSYGYGWYAGDLKNDNQKKLAGEKRAKSLDLDRNPYTVLGMADGFDYKQEKQQLGWIMQAVEMFEARGMYESHGHRRLRESFPKEYRQWLQQFSLLEQFKRGRRFDANTDGPATECVYAFVEGKIDEFNSAYERALEAEPASPVPWHYAGTWLMRDGKLEKADGQFQEALKRDPKYAPTLINRSALLRQQGKLDEALVSVTTGIAADPKLLMPQGLSNRAAIYEAMKRYDEALADWNDMLARQPNNVMALRGRVVTLTKAGRLDEALARSATLLALNPTAQNHALRAEILGARGDHANAALNYTLAMEKDPGNMSAYAPFWSAAVESQRAAHCTTPPANLLELMRPLSVYVRPTGDPRTKITWTGLRTQWQADGALRLFTDSSPGVCLLPDGVRYQRVNADGSRGSVESPAPDPLGRRVYPIGDFAVVYFPSGDFYVGRYGPFTKEQYGRSIECTGVAIKGPYLAGVSLVRLEQVAESTFTRTVDGKPRLCRRRMYNNGMVSVYETGQEKESTEEHKWTWLEFPGMGMFHGTVADGVTPYTGIYTYDDGRRSIVYQGDFVATGAAREELNYSIDATRSIQLHPSGLMGVKLWGYRSDHYVAYDGTGREPFELDAEKPPVVYVPDVQEEEAPAPVVTNRTSAPQLDFGGHRRRGRDPDACYRCRGTGQIWVGGGASQFSRSAPSDLKPGQEQAWINSSASIGVTYTSGHMETCPRCEGTGRR